MMTLALSLSIAVSLLLLFLLWRRGSVGARELPPHSEFYSFSDAQQLEACPPEVVSRVFSPEDWEFVSELKSPELQAVFYAERKALALLWVQQTTVTLRKVMREHAASSRSSEDLRFTSEMQLFLRYAEVRALCAALTIFIETAGPLWPRRLALRVNDISQRIEKTQEAISAAASLGAISDSRT